MKHFDKMVLIPIDKYERLLAREREREEEEGEEEDSSHGNR